MRSYATEAQVAGKSSAAVAAAAVACGLGGYYYYSNVLSAVSRTEALDSAHNASKKAFTGGDQGFISLKLDNVETVNHNTKKFRFALPESDMESGLSVACASAQVRNILQSAVLTKLSRRHYQVQGPRYGEACY